MLSLGKIEELNPASMNINRYLERWISILSRTACQQIRLNCTNNNRLISVIGSKPYDVLADLCSPDAPSAKTYTQLPTILKNHFASKTLIIAEQHRFHNCSQTTPSVQTITVSHKFDVISKCKNDCLSTNTKTLSQVLIITLVQ